ncbi:tandem five-transmembrane protein [Terribacillus aidingensis]|uniref:Tandem five-transmembrane protein n=1 Tax=Terribacillus aidingensis TaxID=586416 RepID=A0A285N1I8_9BACI|nr:DUF443 family protein [Terribacillus aidingensis]SNZ03198.1 tandem five-transmembrane protein [Terribacillus aidingensis]
MSTEAFIILKNFRYQLIKIDNNFYIIDKDKPFVFTFLFPFIYWYFPKKVVQISEESASILQTVPNKDIKSAKLSMFGVGISLLLANLIEPTLDYFLIPISPVLASSIVFLITVILIYFRFQISLRNKRSISKQIKLDSNFTTNSLNIWVFPKSIKSWISLTFLMIFIGAFAAGAMYGFIISGNTFILICYIVFFFMLIFFNIATVPQGKNTLKVIIK